MQINYGDSRRHWTNMVDVDQLTLALRRANSRTDSLADSRTDRPH
jgi:hypothetical protein